MHSFCSNFILRGETVGILRSCVQLRQERPHALTTPAHGPADLCAPALRVCPCVSVCSAHGRAQWAPQRPGEELAEESPAVAEAARGSQSRNLLAQTLSLPTSCSAVSAAVPSFSPRRRQTLRESQLWFIDLLFFLRKAPPSPPSLQAPPLRWQQRARTPSPEPSRRTGRRRAGGAGEVRVASPRGGRRPARRHRRRHSSMTAPSASVTGWSRPPEARVRVGHLRPGWAQAGGIGWGERGPGTGGGKGTATLGEEGARAAEMRLPSPASEARGWALEAQGPQTWAFPRALGWQVVGDVVASWARLHLRRKAQGRGPHLLQQVSERARALPVPAPAPADCSRLPSISHFINCWAALIRVATSKQNAELPKLQRFVFEPLRNWWGPAGSSLQVGPGLWATGGYPTKGNFPLSERWETLNADPDKFLTYHGIISNIRHNSSGYILLLIHSQVPASGS